MSRRVVPFWGNDAFAWTSYTLPMATDHRHDWYLKEWLDTLRQSVAWLEGQTGWTHRIASQLVNRKTRWNRDHLSLAASVLSVAPFELLMHPDDAMQLRRLRADEIKLRVAEKEHQWKGPDDAPTPNRRKAS